MRAEEPLQANVLARVLDQPIGRLGRRPAAKAAVEAGLRLLPTGGKDFDGALLAALIA